MLFHRVCIEPMDPRLASLLTELVEKTGLLRHDLKRKGDLEKYEARIARVDAMIAKIAECVAKENPDLAKALRTAWQQPGRSLAFRNADHQKEMKDRPES